MTRRTNYGLWVDDDGRSNKNELAIDYIAESARSVGIEVIEGKTALDIQFMAEVMKRLREKQEPCEDCVSRQAVLEAFNLSEKTRKYGGDHSGYDTMMLYEIQDVIEDLPSIQPKPIGGDAISRTDAEMCLTADITDMTIEEYISLVGDRLKGLPNIQPKTKTGHWEWVQYEYNSKLGDWHCSECKSVVIECVSKEEKGGIPLYKYCPQCGAKVSENPTDSEKG